MRRVIVCLLAFCLLSLSPVKASAAPSIVYSHATGAEKPRVAITFDDGPHPKYTAQILDILAQYNVRATFFAVGSNAQAYPDLIRRELAEGHEVGNHTFDHRRPIKESREELCEEIARCTLALERLTGKSVELFRPPEGVCSEDVKSICKEKGLTIVLWSIDTRDWAHTPIDTICQNVRENVKDGSIILMHDFIGKNSPTPAALRRIIPMLLELGYELVTVSQLLGEAG